MKMTKNEQGISAMDMEVVIAFMHNLKLKGIKKQQLSTKKHQNTINDCFEAIGAKTTDKEKILKYCNNNYGKLSNMINGLGCESFLHKKYNNDGLSKQWTRSGKFCYVNGGTSKAKTNLICEDGESKISICNAKNAHLMTGTYNESRALIMSAISKYGKDYGVNTDSIKRDFREKIFDLKFEGSFEKMCDIAFINLYNKKVNAEVTDVYDIAHFGKSNYYRINELKNDYFAVGNIWSIIANAIDTKEPIAKLYSVAICNVLSAILNKLLNKYLLKGVNLYKYIAHEAISGEVKFNGNENSANMVFAWDDENVQNSALYTIDEFVNMVTDLNLEFVISLKRNKGNGYYYPCLRIKYHR